ncbi:MAG: amidohydrolase family protein [Chthoniobacterales bacterium]
MSASAPREVVDAHQHLWKPSEFSYSWLEGLPALNRDFLYEDYLAAIAKTPIRKSVFVECDIDSPLQLEEVEWVSRYAALSGSSIAGMVASCRPEEAGFESYLEKLQSFPLVKGLRRVLHVAPPGVMESSLFAENIAKLANYAYTFDLCVLPAQLPTIFKLVSANPGVTFILDHCGVPDIKSNELDPWRENLRQLASCLNVYCKISGLVAYADPSSCDATTLKPYFDHAVECFGAQRILWGGDWPVCTLATTLERWWEITETLTQSWSESDSTNLFSATAKKVYRLA